MKQVAFRVASAATTGGGHVLRCIAVAEVVRALGNFVSFFVDSNHDQIVTRIRLSGYNVQVDSPEVRQSITCKWDAILIDSYELSANDVEFWCNAGLTSFVFDDYDRGCDFCNGRIVSKPFVLTKNNSEKVFYGTDFVPISSSFRKLASLRSGPVKEVLFMFGLRDSVGATMVALEVWRELLDQLPSVNATCIIGSTCPHLNEIKSLIKQFGNKVQVFIDHKDVAQVISKVDIAIGAAGLGLFERASAGVVNIAIPITENQKPLSQWLASRGGCIVLDFNSRSFQRDLRENILELAVNDHQRKTVSRNAMLFVDGFGAERVATELLL